MKLYLLFTIILFSALFIGCVNQIENKKIEGFNIPLPENWIDKSQLSIKENLSKFDLEESEISNLLKTHNGSIPIAIYMKHNPSEFSGPIPTIQVNLRPNNSKNLISFKKVMQKSILQVSDYFSNFTIITPLEEIEIDGIKGIKFVSQFELPNKFGDAWTIRSWTYAFPSGKYFYQINFSDSENENSEEVYKKVINQVRFNK